MHLSATVSAFVLANAFLAVTGIEVRVISWNVEAPQQGFLRKTFQPSTTPLIAQYINKVIPTAPRDVPTVISLQGVHQAQLEEIMASLDGSWGSAGHVKDDSNGATDYNPILFQTDYLSLVHFDTSQIWPQEEKLSLFAKSDRRITMAAFEDVKTKASFLIANTHLDDTDPDARIGEMSTVIMEANHYQKDYQKPMILTGTFNEEPENEIIQALERDGFVDAWESVHHKTGGMGTYTGSKGDKSARYDYIRLKNTEHRVFSPLSFQVLTNKFGRNTISTHKPMVLDIQIV